jgi:glycosyltransferase involved in cell wall biosynthesis
MTVIDSSMMVSVIVPYYKGEKTIGKTIEGILEQSYDNFEIIIINDGSPGKPQLAIEPYLNHDKVTYLETTNGGVASARNYGIERSKGSLIAFCDQDDVWLPKKLELQVPKFEDQNIGLVYGWYYNNYHDGNTELVDEEYEGQCFEQLLDGNFICCCTVIVRKSLLSSIGNFDADRSLMGVDDRYVWSRIAKLSNIALIKEPIATYHRHENNYSSNEKEMLLADLCCINKLEENIILPDFKLGLFNRARANVYTHYGKNFLYNNQYTEAKKCYTESLSISFMQPQVILLYVALSILPSALINWIKIFKRKQ